MSHEKKTSQESVTDSQGNPIKPKSKLAKMIMYELDDTLPTAEEAEKQREAALAFALKLKEENDRK